MVTPLEQVTEFHRVFGCAINQPWTVELGALRARLIAEECRELGEALLAGDPLSVARELADLAYVLLGTAVTFGIKTSESDSWLTNFGFLCKACSELAGPLLFGDLATVAVKLPRVIHRIYGVGVGEGIDLDAAIIAVHIANMSKLGLDGKPIYRLDGKVMKGPNFKAPDLSAAAAGSTRETGGDDVTDPVMWRVGNHMPINVYESDRPICQCHTPEDASRIVAAVNGTELGLASSVDLVTALRNYGVPDVYWRTLVDHISALRRAPDPAPER